VNELTIGSITLDLDARNAFTSGKVVELTAKEFDVIEFLMRNPNRVYSRENLLDTIWAYEYRSDIRTVDVHIRRLREKLEENPAEPKYIMTKWGVGYYFRK
jgi:DNA-binding response OmpR family regulator